MASNQTKHCANCGAEAWKRCLGCIDAPEYEDGDAAETVYCNHRCARRYWRTHKSRCRLLQKRITLSRVAHLLKATILAFRECVFYQNMTLAELRDGILWLDFDRMGSVKLGAFPSQLTSDKNVKESALLNNQCMAAPCILAPLAGHLFPVAGITSVVKLDVAVNALIPYRVIGYDNWDPQHSLLKLQVGDESWILDITGCQYGYPDLITPFHKYEQNKVRGGVIKDEQYAGPYDTNDTTGDLQEIGSHRNGRARSARLVAEHNARKHFTAFVKTYFDDKSAKDFLSGPTSEFNERVAGFADEVKALMTDFMEKRLGVLRYKLKVLASRSNPEFITVCERDPLDSRRGCGSGTGSTMTSFRFKYMVHGLGLDFHVTLLWNFTEYELVPKLTA
ncbi:hypothetical protein F4818DRAFT_436592 [Hypoxylon cercidicola]|nr:hypothetical protein F4818DRAFT_436592 [Hypoxylon cercidicola]